MKKKFLIIPIFLLISCSIIQKPEEYSVQEVKNEILKNIFFWKNCTATGIINFSYTNLEIKENFLFRKKSDKFRVDIFSAGLMGISPSPKAKILYVDSLQIFLPDQKKLYLFDKNSVLNLNLDFDRIIREISEIKNVKNKFIVPVSSNTDLVFAQKFNLELIQKENIKIYLNNYRSGLPYNFIIFRDKKEIANLIIDNWSFPKLEDEIFRLNISDDIEVIKKSQYQQ